MSRLHVLISSTRPGRVGPAVATWIAALAQSHGRFDVHLVDLVDFRLPLLDEPQHPSQQTYTKQHTKAWSASVDAADAFVFVLPEYNYGINAALKNAIDCLYSEWAYKPLGVVSYGGASGGVRAAQAVRTAVLPLRVVPIPDAVTIPNVGEHLSRRGRFVGTGDMATALIRMLNELHRVAGALAPLRQSSPGMGGVA